jgi:WD40 repeat protein
MPDSLNVEKIVPAWTLPWDADWVTAVSFFGTGRQLAAGNSLGEILVWDLPEKVAAPAPAPTRRLDGHSNVISRLLTSADGRWLVSSSYDHTIRVWDMQASGGESATVALNARTREDLQKRGASKVPAALEAKVAVQKPTRALAGHREWVAGLSRSRDGAAVLSGDDAGEIILWDFAAGKETRRWKTKGWAYAVALSPDAKQALVSERRPLVFDSGKYDGIKLWDATTGQVQHDLSPQFKSIYISAAAYSADGKLLALGRGGEVDGMSGKVFLVDPATGKKTKELTPAHQYGVTDLAFHPAGKHLASAGRDTVVRIWDLESGKQVKELGKPRGGQFKDWYCAIAFSPDGHWLAAADMAGQVQVWHLPG